MAFSMSRVVLYVSLMHIMNNVNLEAAPTQSARFEHMPWASPCTPRLHNSVTHENKTLSTVNGNINEHFDILKSKVEDTIQRGENIKNIVTEIFEDSSATEMIKTKKLNGFPEAFLVSEGQQTSTGEKFRIIYTQLSKAAVFLDHIYHVQNEGELKAQLDIIVSDNLSLMCELQIVLLKVGANRPGPANRSIMGNIPQTMSTFQKKERCLNIIFKYKALLSKHLQWYSQSKTGTDS